MNATAPLRVVAALIEDSDGRLFGAERPPGSRHAGVWELPGGKVELGETDEDALARELLEELSVVATVGAQVDIVDHVDSHGVALRLVVYEVTVSGPIVATEHSDTAWLAVSELDSVPWGAADLPCVRRWADRRAR